MQVEASIRPYRRKVRLPHAWRNRPEHEYAIWFGCEEPQKRRALVVGGWRGTVRPSSMRIGGKAPTGNHFLDLPLHVNPFGLHLASDHGSAFGVMPVAIEDDEVKPPAVVGLEEHVLDRPSISLMRSHAAAH